MDDGVAVGDVEVELVERDAAVVFEVLLDLHFDIVAGEVVAQLVAIGPELIRYGREKDPDGHELNCAPRWRLGGRNLAWLPIGRKRTAAPPTAGRIARQKRPPDACRSRPSLM